MSEKRLSEFEKVAAEGETSGGVSEFWQFLRHNKKWWLIPIMVVLLSFGLLLLLASTGAAPFVYSLF